MPHLLSPEDTVQSTPSKYRWFLDREQWNTARRVAINSCREVVGKRMVALSASTMACTS